MNDDPRQVPDPPTEESPEPTRRGRTFWGRAFLVLRALGALLIVLGFTFAFPTGLALSFLFILVIVMAPITLLARIVSGVRGRLDFGFIRHPFRRASRPHLIQLLNRWLFWGMTGITLALSLVPIQFNPEDFLLIRVVVGVSLAVLLALQLIPSRRIRVLGNIPYALGWIFLLMEWARVFSPHPVSDGVVISPPFRGEWYVLQGGRSALVNHHYPIRGQRHALDLVMPVGGLLTAGDPTQLESYAAFGQPLFAPADGKVHRAVNDRPDVAIGQTDLDQIVGNHVVIEMGGGKWVLMAHLMKGSVLVSEGEQVRRGQLIARCGNSGNTSFPHLHLQVQDGPDFESSDLTALPIVFRDVKRIRPGGSREGTVGDLRRNDRIIASPP